MNHFCLLLLFLICCCNLSAQKIGLTSHIGSIIKFPGIATEKINAVGYGTQITFFNLNKNKSYWSNFYNNPEIGIELGYTNYNQKTYGESLSSAIQFRQKLNLNKLKIEYGFSVGFSYLSKKFDKIKNPNNLLLGSHFNLYGNIYSDILFKLTEKQKLKSGIGIRHFSNGRTAIPNFGLNFIHFRLQYEYLLRESKFINNEKSDIQTKKCYWAISSGMGFHEAGTKDGPLYRIIDFNIKRCLMHRKKLSTSIGVEFNQYQSAQRQLMFSQAQSKIGWFQSSTISPFFAIEYYFGHLSVELENGIYLKKHAYSPFPINNTVNISVHLKNTNYSRANNTFVGVQIKTHLFDADYLGVFLGRKF